MHFGEVPATRCAYSRLTLRSKCSPHPLQTTSTLAPKRSAATLAASLFRGRASPDPCEPSSLRRCGRSPATREASPGRDRQPSVTGPPAFSSASSHEQPVSRMIFAIFAWCLDLLHAPVEARQVLRHGRIVRLILAISQRVSDAAKDLLCSSHATVERVSVSAFVDPDDHERLVERARSEDRSISAELRVAIREHLREAAGRNEQTNDEDA